MPELPDLEVFRENIFSRLTSKRLVGLEVFSPQKVQASREVMQSALAGRDLLGIDRVGKELCFDFGDGRIVTAHLMLNGVVSVLPADEAVSAVKFRIFALRFELETVVFSDSGGLCTVKYMPPPGKAPDAFDKAFTLDYFLGVAKRKARTNIKAFLIDQSIVRGIGNAYADEILWAARISPHSTTGKIPQERLAALHSAIDTVLHEAIVSIKSISPDRISGEERSFLKVHNKALRATETGFPIKVERIASKITYHTEEQVLYI